VIRCDHIVQHAKAEALSHCEEPMQITASITRKRKVFDRSFWFEQLEQSNAVELLEVELLEQVELS